MTEFSHQPFLSSLEQAANQTDEYVEFEALLKEQKRDFKEYVKECFFFQACRQINASIS